jgi:sugar lactone lactonase YvrE
MQRTGHTARRGRTTIGRALRVALAAWVAVAGIGATPAAAFAVPLPAPGTVATVIGLGRYNGDHRPATAATLLNPFGQGLTGIAGHETGGLAVGPDGSVYISERLGHRVRKVAPDGTISTFAGTGASGFGGDNGPAAKARLNEPAGLAVGPDGSVYIADSGNRRVRKVAPDGTITTIAGNGLNRTGGNGCPATNASLREPAGLALATNGSGALYIADRAGNQVRELGTDGCIRVLAGRGSGGGSAGDGEQAQLASLDSPDDVAAAPDGSVYIADRNSHRIRVVDPAGMIWTFAGGGRAGDGGSATDTRFGEFRADFTADKANNCSGAAVTPRSRNGTPLPSSGCPTSDRDTPNARFDRPIGVAVGPDGSVYVADRNTNLVRRIMSREVAMEVFGLTRAEDEIPRLEDQFGRPVARVITVAGTREAVIGLQPGAGFDRIDFLYGDVYDEGGPATGAQLRDPTAVAIGPDGALYILDQGNNRVMKVVDPGPSVKPGKIFRVAGAYVGPSGAPASTQLMRPRGVAAAPDGSVYVADGQKSVVRWVSPDGAFTDLVAGTGTRGGAFDVHDGDPARETRLVWPDGVALGPDGSLYIADRGSHRILRVIDPGPNGRIYTVAGTGHNDFQEDMGFSPEGRPATQESLNSPTDVVVAPDGTFYISDTHNSLIRKVTPGGRIFTVAGIGSFGYNGDHPNALATELNQPNGLALGADGTLFFVDTGNACVRKLTPQGAIATVAGMCGKGTGTPGSGFPVGDGGPATEASLGVSNAALAPLNAGGPEGIAVGPDGSLYIADTYNCRIRKVGTDGRIATVVGTGTCGEGGDGGPADKAQVWGPRGLALDKAGNLFIADTDNNKIRVVAAG